MTVTSAALNHLDGSVQDSSCICGDKWEQFFKVYKSAKSHETKCSWCFLNPRVSWGTITGTSTVTGSVLSGSDMTRWCDPFPSLIFFALALESWPEFFKSRVGQCLSYLHTRVFQKARRIRRFTAKGFGKYSHGCWPKFLASMAKVFPTSMCGVFVFTLHSATHRVRVAPRLYSTINNSLNQRVYVMAISNCPTSTCLYQHAVIKVSMSTCLYPHAYIKL